MTYFQALVLGLVQGLTEFLPISSSGHLVLFQTLFGLKEAGVFVDVLVHVGTLVAVLTYFQRDIKEVLRGLLTYWRHRRHRSGSPRPASPPRRRASKAPRAKSRRGAPLVTDPYESLRFMQRIIAASIPTGLMGFFFKDVFEGMFTSLRMTGAAMLLTGVLLIVTRGHQANRMHLPQMTNLHAFIIGIVQGFAIMPGLSRSGSTIAIALLLGFEASYAVRFSFILSIPAIIGALILQLFSIGSLPDAVLSQALFATIAAVFAGYLAIAAIERIASRHRLSYFAFYCWPVGALLVLLGTS